MSNTTEHDWITLSPEGVGCYTNEQDARAGATRLAMRFPNPSAFVSAAIVDALRVELAAATARAEKAEAELEQVKKVQDVVMMRFIEEVGGERAFCPKLNFLCHASRDCTICWLA